MKSHEFAKLINSNYYPHLAKIHPPRYLPFIYPHFYRIATSSTDFWYFFSMTDGHKPFYSEANSEFDQRGDFLAFFILLYICELVAITGHGLIILASTIILLSLFTFPKFLYTVT